MVARPVVALITDFGTRDHYVGVMKAVIASRCPDIQLLDITHDVPPQDIRAAAFTLAAAWPFFPAGTVFVVVVDPGVGTGRPAVALRVGESAFVGPDNGVFDLVIAAQPPTAAVSIDNPRLLGPTISATFEGRDRFAPAAAWLANGTPLEDLGQPVTAAVRLDWPLPRVHADRVVGEVIHVDHYGNLITNLERTPWAPLLAQAEIVVDGRGPIPLVRTYGDAAPGTLVCLFGSTDRLEIATVGGSAAATVGAARGAEVHVVRRA